MTMTDQIREARVALLRELGVVSHGDEQVVAKRLGELLTAVAMTQPEHYVFYRTQGLHDGRRHEAIKVHHDSLASVSEADATKFTEQVLARLRDEVAKRRRTCEEALRTLVGRTDGQDPVALLERDEICYADQREAAKLRLGLVDGTRHDTVVVAAITKRDPACVRVTVTGVIARLKQ